MKLGERSEEISKNRKNKILCSHDDRGYDTSLEIITVSIAWYQSCTVSQHELFPDSAQLIVA